MNRIDKMMLTFISIFAANKEKNVNGRDNYIEIEK
jgi:hypothetical protein